MFLDNFLEIIRSCDTSSTYKMAWAKAITHIACEMEFAENEDEAVQQITLEDIGLNFLGYYWDQDVYFRLHQSSNPNKMAAIVSLVREIELKVNALKGTNLPIKFYRAEGLIRQMEGQYFDKVIQKVVRILKTDVSHRFLPKKMGVLGAVPVYEYVQGDDALYMKRVDMRVLKENIGLVLDVINLKWILILEQYNNSPRIGKKVKHMDYESEGRQSLKKYHRHLTLENPKMLCFICGEPVQENGVSVDHVIPWSFMYSDDLWNLVFVHRSCNSRKSNTIPSEAEIAALKERNGRLLELMKEHPIFGRTKLCFELEDALIHDLARRFWIQCQG